MNSKYDSIVTAADLVIEVQLNGLSTAQEDICRAQDIFGNTNIGELARLANDIGRNNENGEPDPKGSCSSGRKATQGTFYAIISHIWNWEEVTRFWNQHTNPQTKELIELRHAYELIADGNRVLRNANDELEKRLAALLESNGDMATHIGDAQRRAEEAEAEVTRLKAKLYDLLVERKGDELK